MGVLPRKLRKYLTLPATVVFVMFALNSLNNLNLRHQATNQAQADIAARGRAKLAMRKVTDYIDAKQVQGGP